MSFSNILIKMGWALGDGVLTEWRLWGIKDEKEEELKKHKSCSLLSLLSSRSCPASPHLASPCLLLPLSSGNGEKLKQTLVHLLIPPIPPRKKRAHKLSSYFLWPWGGPGAGWASRTRWWGVRRLRSGRRGREGTEGVGWCSGRQGGGVRR